MARDERVCSFGWGNIRSAIEINHLPFPLFPRAPPPSPHKPGEEWGYVLTCCDLRHPSSPCWCLLLIKAGWQRRCMPSIYYALTTHHTLSFSFETDLTLDRVDAPSDRQFPRLTNLDCCTIVILNITVPPYTYTRPSNSSAVSANCFLGRHWGNLDLVLYI